MFESTIDFIQKTYNTKEFLLSYEPVFFGNEKKYLAECIDSIFVSSVGKFVDQFEQMMVKYSGAKYAIATVMCGTSYCLKTCRYGQRHNGTQPLLCVYGDMISLFYSENIG